MQKQTMADGKTSQKTCYNCGDEMDIGFRWYHADQDDLVCEKCAKILKHTDTAYAGDLVKNMPKEYIRNVGAEKLYKVSLTRYPEEFEVFASSEEEAKRKAKEQINWSVWESEVEEVE
jgi:hypothetical protein